MFQCDCVDHASSMKFCQLINFLFTMCKTVAFQLFNIFHIFEMRKKQKIQKYLVEFIILTYCNQLL